MNQNVKSMLPLGYLKAAIFSYVTSSEAMLPKPLFNFTKKFTNLMSGIDFFVLRFESKYSHSN